MDNRQRVARVALLAHEVKRQGTCARTGVPLSVETAVLLVLRTPGQGYAPTVVMTGTEWDKVGERARMVAAAKGQTVRVIDGRELHRGNEGNMRHRRLKLAEDNGETFVEVQSLLNGLRERGYRDAAQEIEVAVLRAKVWKANGRIRVGAKDADRALAA